MVKRIDLYKLVQETLLDSKQNGQGRLYNTQLYNIIKETTRTNISHRDYNAVLADMVDNGTILREESSNHGSKSKVFYSITESAIKEYQHGLLGIDKRKERLRMLYQLLFFYEVNKLGEMRFIKEEDFYKVLKLVDIQKEDLKPIKIMEIPEGGGRITEFEPMKGIKLSKSEIMPERFTLYYVNIPGFSIEEILGYYNKNILNKSSTIVVYSHYYLKMFSHIRFTEQELRTAFQELKKARLIKPISVIPDEDLNPDFPPNLIRYTIADERVKELIAEVWKLYNDKHILLSMKSSIEELDEKEVKWLSYLFGDNVANKMIQNWKVQQIRDDKYRRKSDKNYNERRRDIDRERMKAAVLRLSSEIKEQIDRLNEKYKDIIEEYISPLHLITDISSL